MLDELVAFGTGRLRLEASRSPRPRAAGLAGRRILDAAGVGVQVYVPPMVRCLYPLTYMGAKVRAVAECLSLIQRTERVISGARCLAHLAYRRVQTYASGL
jgi:hypothetical protein